MTRRTARIAFFLVLGGVGGCSSDADTLPVADAERARELRLDTIPSVGHVTAEDYAAESERTASEASDEDAKEAQDFYGRLGFFPRSYDPRSTARAVAGYYGAFYSSTTKDITVIDDATTGELVHELVHALQDQHFDLTRFRKSSTSFDEALAQRALVEGDATMAEYRYEVWATGGDPAAVAAQNVTPGAARTMSEQVLRTSELPLYFISFPSFVYSYGVSYVATLLGVRHGSWSYGAINGLLGANGPESTQEILHGRSGNDPIEATGFSALPAELAADYKVVFVDRLGEYLTYLLLYSVVPADALARLVANWDGDQAVLLARTNGDSAVAWTSIWETEADAAQIVEALARLHTAGGALVDGSAYTARDGESLWIERHGREVCLVKNVAPEQAAGLARRALGTVGGVRLEIARPKGLMPVMP